MKHFEDYFDKNFVSQQIDSAILYSREYIIDFGETIVDYFRFSWQADTDAERYYLRPERVKEFDDMELDEQAEVTDLLYDYLEENYNYYLDIH